MSFEVQLKRIRQPLLTPCTHSCIPLTDFCIEYVHSWKPSFWGQIFFTHFWVFFFSSHYLFTCQSVSYFRKIIDASTSWISDCTLGKRMTFHTPLCPKFLGSVNRTLWSKSSSLKNSHPSPFPSQFSPSRPGKENNVPFNKINYHLFFSALALQNFPTSRKKYETRRSRGR